MPIEKRLRRAMSEIISGYESDYEFHNRNGHFIERVVSHLNSHIKADERWKLLDLQINEAITWVRTSLSIALMGCKCKDDQLSIPCSIRQTIEEQIIDRLLRLEQSK